MEWLKAVFETIRAVLWMGLYAAWKKRREKHVRLK